MTHTKHRVESTGNRRRFFRIDDEIILQYQELPHTGGDRVVEMQARIPTAFLLCSRLAEYRQRMRPLLRQVRLESEAVSKAMTLLDAKVDLLANLLLVEDVDLMSAYRSRVQLSAGGIVFRTNRPFMESALLDLQFILLPSFIGIITQGRVIKTTRYLREVEGCLFSTTVEFANMKESTRDLIAKHVWDKKIECVRREKG